MITYTNITLSPLAHQILDYLNQNPNAQDSAEGLSEWWLLEQRVSLPIENVRGALNELTAHRLVLESIRTDGRWHYRLNPLKRQTGRIN